ncbi:unnamed protein product [Cuscuta europaea]|uniref:Uncharacterized protein n=1 Tax=Cuscuta europaea TaxID=41803 RepID=A0A9P1E2Q5_CUSEU|nr:unnamed protein product [Cuscuta europaea]
MARVTTMKEAGSLQKRLDDMEATHRIMGGELRRKAEEVGPAAVRALKEGPELQTEVDWVILVRRAKIALGWLQTPEGEDRLAEEGTQCLQLGKFDMQKFIYEAVLNRDPSFCAKAWGLPSPIAVEESSVPTVPAPEVPPSESGN